MRYSSDIFELGFHSAHGVITRKFIGARSIFFFLIGVVTAYAILTEFRARQSFLLFAVRSQIEGTKWNLIFPPDVSNEL